MDKELKEAVKRLNRFSHITVLYSNTVAMDVQELKQVQQDVETLVQAVENSIPKEVVEEKILELNAKYPKGSTNDFTETERDHKVSVLQELLQEKGE